MEGPFSFCTNYISLTLPSYSQSAEKKHQLFFLLSFFSKFAN